MTFNDSQKKRNSTLADDALKKSLARIELIPEPDQKLKLYYIASMLFKKAGQDRSQKLKRAEALRSRALAMADRLDAESDVRRRAHRDMAIWYLQLGKNESAVREKQALFGLVGFKDDTLLYPQSGPCGLLTWWERPGSGRTNFDCGMG